MRERSSLSWSRAAGRAATLVALTLLLVGAAQGCSSSDDPAGGPGPGDGTDLGSPDAGGSTDLGQEEGDLGADVDSGPFDGGGPYYIDAGDVGVLCQPDELEHERVAIQLGNDLPPWLTSRLSALLAATGEERDLWHVDAERLPHCMGPGSTILAFGEGAVAKALIPSDDPARQALGEEGYLIRRGELLGHSAVAVIGKPSQTPPRDSTTNSGLSYGAFALLKTMGYGFLHPLAPIVADDLSRLPSEGDTVSEPRWGVRGIHLSTNHPTELTHVLNGWGKTGTGDAEGWEELRAEWTSFLEWAVANGLNWVEWALLHEEGWAEFSDGGVRRERLRHLVEDAHARGLRVAIVAPLGLTTEHAWSLVREEGSLASERSQIEARIDYLMATEADALITDLGVSDVDAERAQRSLDRLEAARSYLAETFPGRKLFARAHSSSFERLDTFPDPVSGAPSNANFLARFADRGVGLMPHTAQLYALDDPAPTQNNSDYSEVHELIAQEAGARDILWQPETSHWLSYDVDVPLFLPLYADRRLHDLRLIAEDEDAGRLGRGAYGAAHIEGQVFVSSGWEWGYWLNDLVAARASWNPLVEAADQDAALRQLLKETFGPALEGVGDHLTDLIADIVAHQRQLLIHGEVDGAAPAEVHRRNGQAYLQGQETWDEVGQLIGLLPGRDALYTQPSRLDLMEMRSFIHDPPAYEDEIEPLLDELEQTLTEDANRFEDLHRHVPEAARPLLEDLDSSMRMTALRARQINGLYDYVSRFLDDDDGPRMLRLDDAREALDEAAVLVAEREAAYRADPERIAGWGVNPTGYSFGYLWTVRSLFYWWRDEGKAVDAPLTPCYLNIVNPIEAGMGEGFWPDLGRTVREIAAALSWGEEVAECLAEGDSETPEEPTFPQDGLRERP